MAVIRVNKNGDYTVMSNVHFRERTLSLQAKGLLSLMLSLPDGWDYSVAGLVPLSKNGRDSVMAALNELKQHGYLRITKLFPNETKSRRIEYVYDVFETPQPAPDETEKCGKQGTGKQGLEKQGLENPPQLNTKESNTKESNTLLYSFNHSTSRACACDDGNVNEGGDGGDLPSPVLSEEELAEERRIKGRGYLGGLGRGVVMLSEEQMESLLDELTLDEFGHYVGVVANCVLSGKKYTKKTHYQAILDMAKADRRTKRNAR